MSAQESVSERLLFDKQLLDIEFAREKGNVLTGSLLKRIDATLVEHASLASLKLVLLRGAGKHFSFGAAVEEHRKDHVAGMLATFHQVCRRIVAYPVPVATVVGGRCLGGAFELAVCSHFVIAQRSSVFACPEIKLGVFPPVLAALGPERLGRSVAEHLLLTGTDLDAVRGRELGFVTDLVADETDLTTAAADWFQKHLAPLSAFAVRQGVAALRAGWAPSFAERLADAERRYLNELMAGTDPSEGIEAFIARRPARWVDG